MDAKIREISTNAIKVETKSVRQDICSLFMSQKNIIFVDITIHMAHDLFHTDRRR